MDGNVSITNHIIHFILGVVSFRFGIVTGLFLLYQLIDGIKFGYNVTYKKNESDDIPLDLLYFSLGALSIRFLLHLHTF